MYGWDLILFQMLKQGMAWVLLLKMLKQPMAKVRLGSYIHRKAKIRYGGCFDLFKMLK